MSLPEPQFIERDPATITAQLVAQYEQLSGKTLYPAQAERLLIDVIAYRETLLRIGIQEAAKQNLLAFARAPMLDYLGELLGVTRLPAQAAKTTLQFSIETALATDFLIPLGSRVEGGDSVVSFATDSDTILPAGQLSVNASATCEEAGSIGNAWQPGQINSLVDELSDFDISVANTTTTAGGIDDEEDERLRERIKLAPESFSNAGSRLAYRFHALKAHQSIIDVAVLTPKPGVVRLYPLLTTGLPDNAILALVLATCSDERVRPLTDTVQAASPVAVPYRIDADLWLYAGSEAAMLQVQALAEAERYQTGRAMALGRDLVPSQIIAALQLPGVYRVQLNQPALTTLAENEWPDCQSITIRIAGVVND
ncbi:baseplate J/gp47 family protein [Neisseriaceae bacterium TC5R-5]|nr:baseplate J/gp47 family protein [Neisseriaceae bacterium TC5R-5]